MLPFDKSRCRESILEIYQKWGQGKMKHEKPELSRKNPYCLPKYRYLELKNFCFQYNDWKRALARLDGWRAQEGDIRARNFQLLLWKEMLIIGGNYYV